MKKQYRNIAFLAELMINILVFSISCAILVGLFGTAGRISSQAREKSLAGARVLAMVERIKVRGAAGVEEWEWQDDSVLCSYDENWQPVEAGRQAAYVIRLTLSPSSSGAGTLNRLTAVAERIQGVQTEEIYRVQTSSYVPAKEDGV